MTEAEPRREIALLMWKHGAITGVVTDEIGEPLIGIAIQSFKRTEVNGVRRFVAAARAATDDRGIYRLPNLPPGDYMVAASSRQIAVPLSLADESRDRRAAPLTDATLGGPVPMPGNASATATRRQRPRSRARRGNAAASGRRSPVGLSADVSSGHADRRSTRPPWLCAPAKSATASTCSCVPFEPCGYRDSSAALPTCLPCDACDWCRPTARCSMPASR